MIACAREKSFVFNVNQKEQRNFDKKQKKQTTMVEWYECRRVVCRAEDERPNN